MAYSQDLNISIHHLASCLNICRKTVTVRENFVSVVSA